MVLVRMAWDNLFYNIKRTALSVLLIAVALSAVLLFKGYVEYTREGMALGYIARSGHLQIAESFYWKNGSGASFLDGEQLGHIRTLLADTAGISRIEPVLEFSGIIGTADVSTIFWAAAYDHPELGLGVIEGSPVFPGEEAIVIGSVLADTLDMHPDMSEEPPEVNLMSSIADAGLSVSTFTVSGVTTTGIPQSDAGLVLTSRAAALDFLGVDEGASYVQVHLQDRSQTEAVQQALSRLMDEGLEVRNWRELNPSYDQINGLNETQYAVVSLILCVLIFVALTQSLAAAFNERLNEYGTLEAVGLKKRALVVLLAFEAVFLALLGIILGFALSAAVSELVRIADFRFVPPGYSSGYALHFYITAADAVSVFCFIFCTCLLATVLPVSHVLRNSAVRLISRL